MDTCLDQLRSDRDEERLVGLLMLTKLVPVDSLSDPTSHEQALMRQKVFDAVGDTFLKRLLQTKDDDGAHRALALSIISCFVVDAPLARKFRSATPVFCKVLRSCGDRAAVRDALACFAGVLSSGADISAAHYGKCVVSLVCGAATLSRVEIQHSRSAEPSEVDVATPAGNPAAIAFHSSEDMSRMFVSAATRALELAKAVVSLWASSCKPEFSLSPAWLAELDELPSFFHTLSPLTTHRSLDVSLAAVEVIVACLERPVVRNTLILSSRLLAESSHILRQCTKGLLSVYGSQAHVDAGLRLAKVMLESCPESVTSQPQFVLVSLRQASIEVKMISDEVEHVISGLSDAGERRLCELDFGRARLVMDCCGSMLESTVHHLTTLGDDSDDDETYDNVPLPAPSSSTPELNFDALQKLFSSREGTGPSDAEFEAERKKAAEQDTARMRQLVQVFPRWRMFPGEVLLRLKSVLDEFLRVLVTFVSIIAHTPSVCDRMTSNDAQVPPTTGVDTAEGLSFAVHTLVTRCVHAFGRVLADDADSYTEELMDVLPLCLRLQCSPYDVVDGPVCLHRPIVSLLPALMLVTTDSTILCRVCDMDGHVMLARWYSDATKAFMLLRMQARVAPADHEPVPFTPLLSQLSIAASVFVNIVALLPLSRMKAVFDLSSTEPAKTWMQLLKSACTLADVLSSPGRVPAESEAISNAVIGGIAVSLHVLLSAQSVSKLDQLSVELTGAPCSSMLRKGVGIARRLSDTSGPPTGDDLDVTTVFQTAMSRVAKLLPP